LTWFPWLNYSWIRKKKGGKFPTIYRGISQPFQDAFFLLLDIIELSGGNLLEKERKKGISFLLRKTSTLLLFYHLGICRIHNNLFIQKIPLKSRTNRKHFLTLEINIKTSLLLGKNKPTND
jgi:hypothetical protein